MIRHARIEIRPAEDSGTRAVNGRLTILPPSERTHYLRLVAANGRVLATSETYSNRRNARAAVAAWAYAFEDVLRDDRLPCDIRAVEFDADGQQVPR